MAGIRKTFDCKYLDCKSIHFAKGYCEIHYRTQYLRKIIHPLYMVWRNMKNRCYNPNEPRYKDWGGRGITVCEEWRNNYQAFEDYMGKRPKGHTLDRIDNNGNYEPGNVRWATPKEQAANRRKQG